MRSEVENPGGWGHQAHLHRHHPPSHRWDPMSSASLASQSREDGPNPRTVYKYLCEQTLCWAWDCYGYRRVLWTGRHRMVCEVSWSFLFQTFPLEASFGVNRPPYQLILCSICFCFISYLYLNKLIVILPHLFYNFIYSYKIFFMKHISCRHMSVPTKYLLILNLSLLVISLWLTSSLTFWQEY